MEKDRGTKVIAIVALIVAVVGLSLGFAAFSSTLTIPLERFFIFCIKESHFDL